MRKSDDSGRRIEEAESPLMVGKVVRRSRSAVMLLDGLSNVEDDEFGRWK